MTARKDAHLKQGGIWHTSRAQVGFATRLSLASGDARSRASVFSPSRTFNEARKRELHCGVPLCM